MRKLIAYTSVPAVVLTAAFCLSLWRSERVQRIVGGALCPEGFTLSMAYDDEGGTETSIGSLTVVDRGWAPYCYGPQNQYARCTLCIVAAASPMLMWVLSLAGASALSLLHAPTTADHISQLDMLLHLGALTQDRYDELRRLVLASPGMTSRELGTLLEKELKRPST
jgi:hypothetical protein